MTGLRQRPDAAQSKKVKSLIAAMAVFLLPLFLSLWGIYSMLGDCTGEYAGYDPGAGQIEMSLLHDGEKLHGELMFGPSAIMEMDGTPPAEDGKLDCKFFIPEKWIQQGQDPRQVNFHGIVKDGVVKGVLQEGKVVTSVVLDRSVATSIYKQVRSHLPFGNG